MPARPLERFRDANARLDLRSGSLAKEAENNPFFYATRLSVVRHGCKAKLISLRFLFRGRFAYRGETEN